MYQIFHFKKWFDFKLSAEKNTSKNKNGKIL